MKRLSNTFLKLLGTLKVPEPKYGDFKLNVFPFENNNSFVKLPKEFNIWEKPVNNIINQIPLQTGR